MLNATSKKPTKIQADAFNNQKTEAKKKRQFKIIQNEPPQPKYEFFYTYDPKTNFMKKYAVIEDT